MTPTPPPCPACQSLRVLPGPNYDPGARRCMDCGWRARLEDTDTTPKEKKR